jgi:DNA-binding beta-propeller fold protein YncE
MDAAKRSNLYTGGDAADGSCYRRPGRRRRHARCRGQRRSLGLLPVAIAITLGAWPAPAALGADSVYWATSNGNAIRVGNLAGTGSPANVFTGETSPDGVVIDPAAGKLYWADGGFGPNTGAIRVGNLDGSGSASNLFAGGTPVGVAIDPAVGKLYWADNDSGAIRVGNLSGSGSAVNLFTGESGATGDAIDPAAGKIYWARGGAIRVGNLNGTGSPSSLFTGESGAVGVAIDRAAGKLYWANSSGTIRVGNLDGTGSPSSLFTGENVPQGVAIDPAAGKLYWADAGPFAPNSGAIRVGNLNGIGPASGLFTGEDVPVFLSLLRAPAGTGAPTVSGTGQVGSPLSCSQGSWAADVLGAFLYRAPRSFAYQWQQDGTDIGGAIQATYTPTAAGGYSCRVTAANQAGSMSQTSALLTVSAPAPGQSQAQSAPPSAGPPLIAPPAELSPDNAFLFPRVTTAPDGETTFTFDFPGRGTLDALATTHKLRAHAAVLRPGPNRVAVGRLHASADAPGPRIFHLPLNATGRRILAIRGKLPIRLTLVYTPTGGQSSRQARKYTAH